MKINELLPPDAILPMMQEKSLALYSAIRAVERRQMKAVEGRLRLARQRNSVHYFHVTDTSSEWGDYLPMSETATIKSLVQKDYDSKALKELKRELLLVDEFIDAFHQERMDEIFEKIGPERRAFAEPLRLSDKVYTERWLSVKYSGKPFGADAPKLFTSRGEQVRSKSEVIIADALARLGVPYRYEFPHQLKVRGDSRGSTRDYDSCGDSNRRGVRACARKGSRREQHSAVFYPDFTCLNVRTRREIIWEHFGRMDDPEYATATAGKFDSYADNGIFPGESLVFTMETQERPLSPATVEAIVEKYLL